MYGRQIGFLWTEPGKNGVEIVIHNEYSYDYTKIENGQRSQSGFAAYLEIYDERQGCNVPGVMLLDNRGNPTNELYKLRDFQMTGNLSWTPPV